MFGNLLLECQKHLSNFMNPYKTRNNQNGLEIKFMKLKYKYKVMKIMCE